MTVLVLSFVTVSAVGLVAKSILFSLAWGDWRFERTQEPRETDREWVAIDLLISALFGLAQLVCFFSAGALVEAAREGRLARTTVLYQSWPYLITAGVGLLALRGVFHLYSRYRLQQLQESDRAVAPSELATL